MGTIWLGKLIGKSWAMLVTSTWMAASMPGAAVTWIEAWPSFTADTKPVSSTDTTPSGDDGVGHAASQVAKLAAVVLAGDQQLLTGITSRQPEAAFLGAPGLDRDRHQLARIAQSRRFRTGSAARTAETAETPASQQIHIHDRALSMTSSSVV